MTFKLIHHSRTQPLVLRENEGFDFRETQALLQRLEKWGVTWEIVDVSDDELMNLYPARVFSLSMRWNLSVYDGAYLGLAEKLESAVWTGDRAFYTSCQGRGSRVRWIGDYPRAAR